MASGAKALSGTKSEVALENMFTSMAKKGDSKADGKAMTPDALEQWLTNADAKISKGEVAAIFHQMGKPTLTFADFTNLITELAKTKGVDVKTLRGKLLTFPESK